MYSANDDPKQLARICHDRLQILRENARDLYHSLVSRNKLPDPGSVADADEPVRLANYYISIHPDPNDWAQSNLKLVEQYASDIKAVIELRHEILDRN